MGLQRLAIDNYLSIKMTIIQQACSEVPNFEPFYSKFIRRLSVLDRAKSTQISYGRSLASLALHYKRSPFEISTEEIQDFLFLLKEEYSDHSFRFLVIALRFACRMEGKEPMHFKLPALRKKRKLPVVLSKEEITAMMNLPVMLKHRVLIALLYGCGLRCSEVRNLKVNDIDLDRSVLHVRQSKGRKDRYLPLGETLRTIMQKYIRQHRTGTWLFNGGRNGKSGSHFFYDMDTQFGKRSIQWAVKRAAQLAKIRKSVNVHSLRHTYATHLLEDGVNILTIRELLGHADIHTTMIYLHVAQVDDRQKKCPLDALTGLHVIGKFSQGVINF